MSDYSYVAIDVAGQQRRGRIAAAGPEEARAGLAQRRLYVVALEPGKIAAERSDPLFARFSWARKAMSTKELTLFTRQLATLAQVSPLEESLRTISRQSEKGHVRSAVMAVHAGVFEGQRLADAMGRQGKSFPPLYRAMVSAGESAGTLPAILDRLSILLERQAVVRSKIMASLAYPIVLATVAMAVVGALMIFVVPKVVEQFETVGQQLPLLTRIVIAISHFAANWWWALGIAFVCLGIFCGHVLRDEGRRLRFDAALLGLPGLGRLIRDLHAARMARTLSTMVASRLPLYEGVSLTIGTIRNRALRAAMLDVAEGIRGGGSLSNALQHSGHFPALLVYLAASGESSGQLDLMLERAADYLEREFDTFTTAALSILEPAIIVLMGGIVAAIVLSILLPILQLESLAGI